MSVDIRSSERRRYMNELQAREKEIAAGLLKASQPASPKGNQESDKRIRREIANSNERRRMQCINAGFSNLRAIIPMMEGEKLSKAAILQQTKDYITNLVKEKARLQVQLERSNHLLAECGGQDRMVTDSYISNSPPPSKRKKRDTESSDEGVGSLSDASDEGSSAELRQENMKLRHQLEMERQKIAGLEEQNRILETQLMSFINMAPPPPSHHNGRDVQAVKVEAAYPPVAESWPVFKRDVVEVVATDGPVSEAKSYLPPPRPLSPTPERGMAMEVSMPIDCHAPPAVETCVEYKDYTPYPVIRSPEPVERPRVNLTPDIPLAVVTTATPPAPSVSAPPAVKPATEVRSPHHHNYCHRDHPRRRLRQQAQLDQQRAEEEARRQQELQQQQQQQQQTLATAAYRPKPSTQNLENLVEAIRQIEGDRVLCQIEGERSVVCSERKLYEEEERLYSQRKSIPSAEDSERDTNSISDHEEYRAEMVSGRESPRQSPAHLSSYLRQSQSPSVIPTIQVVTSVITSSAPNSSNYSEKYPIATGLLHRPLPHPLYRPDVILHKQ